MRAFEKTVVYFGGLGGIGLGTCHAIMSQKPKFLVISDILSPSEASAVLQELREISPSTQLLYFGFDLTQPIEKHSQLLKEILAKVGKIDVLVNGAGICDDSKIDLTIKINLLSTINTSTAMFDIWNKQNGGSGGLIVNVASAAALSSFPYVPVYSASKWGVLGFTHAMAKLEPITGIRVCAVCPGATQTPLLGTTRAYRNIVELHSLTPTTAMQLPEVCGANILEVIERNQNGTIFLLDDGQIEVVDMKMHWEAKL